MSGGAEISSATRSCLCPPDCCSPEVEKENYVWFLIKVLIRNLFILSHHLLIIVLIFINFLHATILLTSFVQVLSEGALRPVDCHGFPCSSHHRQATKKPSNFQI